MKAHLQSIRPQPAPYMPVSEFTNNEYYGRYLLGGYDMIIIYYTYKEIMTIILPICCMNEVKVW